MRTYSRLGSFYSADDAAWSPLIFPGGEAHVASSKDVDYHQIAVVEGGSGDELMLLAMWADACNRRRQYSTAIIPYLPGARQDRGVPLGAKVYADFINSMNIDRIVCFDPHSDVMPAMIDRLVVVPIEAHPFWSLEDHFQGVICPDVGARKRSEAVASKLGVPVYQAFKHRDFRTGKLSGFTCEELPPGNLIVVDDICDGGGTFNGLAEVIKVGVGHAKHRLNLWVSHGIFSKGVDTLLDHYDCIFTTDSHKGAKEEVSDELRSSGRVVVQDLLPFLLNEADKVT